MSEIKKTMCYICDCFCGIDVAFEDGRMTKVEGILEHPIEQRESLPPWVIPLCSFNMIAESDPENTTTLGSVSCRVLASTTNRSFLRRDT